MIILIVALLAFRIIFGLYLWPLRLDGLQAYKEDAIKIAEMTSDEDVEILFWENLHHGLSFYLTQEKWQILPSNPNGLNIIPDKYYIIDENNLRELKENGYTYDQYMQFKPMDEWRNIFLIKFDTIGILPENKQLKNIKDE